MKDGTHVDADFIISATGLTLGQNLPFSTIKVGFVWNLTFREDEENEVTPNTYFLNCRLRLMKNLSLEPIM